MKRLVVLSSLLLVFFVTSWTASADTVKLTGTGNTVWNGVYAGPYSATLNGNSISMICISFDRHVSTGQEWQATVNPLTASGVANGLYGSQQGALSDFQQDGPQQGALLKYQQAAWLFDQISVRPNEAGDIHGAIWNIFNPGVTPDTDGSNAWLSVAQNQNFANYDFSKFRILTPADGTAAGPQENLTTVPEPATMFLLGTGLAGVAGAARRKSKARQNSEQV